MKKNIFKTIIIAVVIVIASIQIIQIFHTEATNKLNFARFAFSMIDIGNDKILVIGGDGGSGKDVTKKAELIELKNNRVKSLPDTNFSHRQSLLVKNKKGEILIIDDAPIEIYNPSSEQFTPTNYCVLDNDCANNRFSTNKKFIASPYDAENVLIMALTKENYQKLYLYNFENFTLKPLANFIIPRDRYNLTLLNDGQILINGGISKDNKEIKIAELYNPKTGQFEKCELDSLKNIIAKIELQNERLYITYSGTYLLNTKTNQLQQVNNTYDKLAELLKNKRYYQISKDKILIFENSKLTNNSKKIMIYDLKTNTQYYLKEKVYSAIDKNIISIDDKVLFIGGRKNLNALDSITVITFN